MHGGSGRDTIISYMNDDAYGESGNDRLIGYDNAQLWGGQGSDTFELHQRIRHTLSPRVLDFSHSDRVVVKFDDRRSFGGIIPADNNSDYVIMDSNNNQVGRLFIDSLEGFNIRATQDGAVLTITGSDFA